jgi:hypothetical protein
MMGATMGAVCLALAGCDGQDADEPKVDVAAELAAIDFNPKTLEEAEVQFARLDALSKRSAHDPRVMAATQRLADNVEPLNGLIEKITVGEGHTISFYADEDSISVGELMPRSATPRLRPLLDKGLGVTELFEALAPGRAMPAAFLESAERPYVESASAAAPPLRISPATSSPVTPAFDGVTTARSALTAADGPLFADTICPKWGPRQWCLPNWGNGGGVDSVESYTHSRHIIAPFEGDALNVRRLFKGSLKATYTVFPGQIHDVQNFGRQLADCSCCFGCDFYWERGRHNWEITNAALDFFHWGGNIFNQTIPPGR